jgi:hypothetical protein
MRNGDASTNNSQGEKCRRFVRETVLPYSGDECLIWPFYRDPDGYAGKIRWNTRDPEAACRVICREVHGEPPADNSQAAHNCGNGHLGCVNPKHLQWKMPKENKADELIHGTRNRGVKNVYAKLDESNVLETKKLINSGDYTNREIAEMFGVSDSMIGYIRRGKNWGWISL